MPRSPGNLETEPETAPRAPIEGASPPSLGFAVLWSSDRADHVGAWLGVPLSERGASRILGRGGAQPDDEFVRLRPVRQRPGAVEPLEPFENRSLSRTQLLVQAGPSGVLSVKNVGQCQLSLNGAEVDQAEVRPGDVLELGSQLVLLCVPRAGKFPGPPPDKDHAFGRADRHGFVGESEAAWRLRAEVAKIAPRSGHTLVFGATGTGKELVAGALHALSGRTGALVSRNAATLPEALVDAELFGNLKDYPNPGMPDRKGLMGAADRGTLFLDEFAELPMTSQAHVLRALDGGEYQRLGEATVRHSQFRLVGATNRPETALRADLLARFDFRIRLPELGERREDIPFIARHLFLKMADDAPELCARFSTDEGAPKLSQAFVSRLARHSFPGNVRELRSLLWSSLHEAEGDWLEWPGETPNAQRDGRGAERAELERVLAENGGSVEKSWRALGLSSRYALMRLLKKHGIKITKQLGSKE